MQILINRIFFTMPPNEAVFTWLQCIQLYVMSQYHTRIMKLGFILTVSSYYEISFSHGTIGQPYQIDILFSRLQNSSQVQLM